MPFSLALAGILAGIAGAGATVGNTIYQDVSKPGAPAPPPPLTAAQNISNEQSNRTNQALLLRQQIPNQIDATNGSLSDQSYLTDAATSGGIPGAVGQGGPVQGGYGQGGLSEILNFLQGNGGGSSPGLSGSPGGSNIMDLATATGGIT